ncbi:MAG: hypothetical protein ACK4K7_04395 [Allosphingosinicella sp.]|uniref:hypothetical protein n=1 Tax=Allosphingosinicella sp. TaxID=2823234 RepID=UPI00396153C0
MGKPKTISAGHGEEAGDLPGYVPPDAEGRELLRAQSEYAAALRAFVQIGIDAADRGDLISHEQVMADLKKRFGGKDAV